MSRKPIADIDSKIIHATISLGGTNDANRDFSTKDIATSCGVSEFVIFSHFKNKDQLMIAADHAVYRKIIGEARLLTENPISMHDFVNLYLDWFLAHPELTFFALNYGHGVPHVVPIKDDHTVHGAMMAEDAKRLFRNFNIHEDDEFLLVWAYTLRHLIYFAGHLLNYPASDTLPERLQIEKLLNHGLQAFTLAEEESNA
jgi:AcrR family transcriptional regulator